MTKTFDVRAFEAFCRSKPAEEKYVGVLSSECALAQFGFVGVNGFSRHRLGISADAYRAAVFHGYTSDRPDDFYTLGALAERLAKLP